MLAGFAILLVSLAVIYLEVPGLLRGNRKKEIAAFSFVLFAATVSGLALVLRIPLPHVEEWVVGGLKPVSDWFDHLVQN